MSVRRTLTLLLLCGAASACILAQGFAQKRVRSGTDGAGRVRLARTPPMGWNSWDCYARP